MTQEDFGCSFTSPSSSPLSTSSLGAWVEQTLLILNIARTLAMAGDRRRSGESFLPWVVLGISGIRLWQRHKNFHALLMVFSYLVFSKILLRPCHFFLSFLQSFVLLSQGHMLITYYILGNVLDIWNIIISKTDIKPTLMKLMV